MLIRAVALSVALLVGIGVIVPLATDTTSAHPYQKRKQKRTRKHYKKYSKKWWTNYRSRQRKRSASRRYQRSLRLRQLRLARQRATQDSVTPVASTPSRLTTKRSVLPSGQPAPQAWNVSDSSSSELKFRIDDSAGSQVGSASISVVGPAVGDSKSSGRKQTVGGVSTVSLRREVINKMIQENGWVVNDYQKQVGGNEVYVVVAQSQAKTGRVNSRMFYFTEVDGRIYSVATNSPVESTERLAAESEKVIDSLRNRVRPAQRASLKD